MMPWVGLLCVIGVFPCPTHIFEDFLSIALPGGPATSSTAHLPYTPILLVPLGLDIDKHCRPRPDATEHGV